MNETNDKNDAASARIPESANLSTSKDNVYCELEGEAVILNLHDGIYYGLNAVGLRIWELLQTPRTLGGVLDVLTEEYEVEREACCDDVVKVLDEMAQKGLVQIEI